MGRTPDRFPGTREEEALQFDVDSVHPTQNGEVRYVTGEGFKFYEEGAEVGLSGSGLSTSQHNALRALIHFIDDGPAEGFASGAYKETIGTVFPTSEIWWESAAKLKKIVELTTTWTGVVPTTEEWKMYDTDGSTVLTTVTDTISYSTIFETSRTRTIA